MASILQWPASGPSGLHLARRGEKAGKWPARWSPGDHFKWQILTRWSLSDQRSGLI